MDTYEENIRHIKHNTDAQETNEYASRAITSEWHSRGRPQNDRVPYLPQHPKATHVQRVCRSSGHRNLPNIIGRYFPRRDDPETYPFYCACMLVLLKPWRNLHSDLKESSQTWTTAFDEFIASSPNSERLRFILSGIQYFHDCESAVIENQSREDLETHGDIYRGSIGHQLKDLDDLDGEEGIDMVDSETEEEFTEEGLAEKIAAQTSLSEEVHALLAVEVARHTKIFSNSLSSTWNIDRACPVGNASGDDLRKLISWKDQMKADILRTMLLQTLRSMKTHRAVLPCCRRVTTSRYQMKVQWSRWNILFLRHRYQP